MTEKKTFNLPMSPKEQLVWELLNAAHYDFCTDNHADGITAIEEAIKILEGDK